MRNVRNNIWTSEILPLSCNLNFKQRVVDTYIFWGLVIKYLNSRDLVLALVSRELLTLSGFGDNRLARLAGLSGPCFVNSPDSELVLYSFLQVVCSALAVRTVQLCCLGPLGIALLSFLNHVTCDGWPSVLGWWSPLQVHIVSVPVRDVWSTWCSWLIYYHREQVKLHIGTCHQIFFLNGQ